MALLGNCKNCCLTGISPLRKNCAVRKNCAKVAQKLLLDGIYICCALRAYLRDYMRGFETPPRNNHSSEYPVKQIYQEAFMKTTHIDFYREQIEKANDALRGGRSEQATQFLLLSMAKSLAAIADHLEEN